MMPTLHCAGVTIPGQLGPSNCVPARSTYARARTISCTGIPSVMHTVSATAAADASMMASAANAGGTKMPATLASVAATASATVSKTGTPLRSPPPLPGDTPATMLVPNARICSVWKLPSRPVIPWITTLLERSTSTLIAPDPVSAARSSPQPPARSSRARSPRPAANAAPPLPSSRSCEPPGAW